MEKTNDWRPPKYWSLSEDDRKKWDEEAHRAGPRKDFENIENVSRISSKNADYKIVYSSHLRKNNPEDVKGSDAIFLEFMFDYSKEGEVEDIIDKQLNQDGQYSEIIKYAAENNIPVYFVDLSLKTLEGKDFHGIENAIKKNLIPVLGLTAGYKLIKSSVKDMKTNGVTRRSFLKTLGKTMIGAYASTPGLEPVSALASTKLSQHEPDENSSMRHAQRDLSKLNDSIHPYLKSYRMEGRNCLIAHKAEIIAEDLSDKLGHKPRLSIVIGAMHVDIEDDLKMDDIDRVRQLSKYFNNTEIENEKTIVRIDFDNSEGEIKPEVKISNLDF
jgi:hypothetical protein